MEIAPSRAVPGRPGPGKASQSVGGPSQTLFGLIWVFGTARDGVAALKSSENRSAGGHHSRGRISLHPACCPPADRFTDLLSAAAPSRAAPEARVSPKSVWDGPPTLWDAFPGPGRPGSGRVGAGSTRNIFLPRRGTIRRMEHQVCAAAHIYMSCILINNVITSITWIAVAA